MATSKGPPINIAYLTTLSELARDEKVGSVVVDPESGHMYGRRVGNLEALVQQLGNTRSALHGAYKLVGVAFDDNPEDVQAYQRGAVPWPWDLAVPGHPQPTTVGELAFNIPSRDWRSVKGIEARAIAKAVYEASIVRWLDRIGADLVVSDSYTRIVGPTLLEWLGTHDGAAIGRGLNIHPAIAQLDSPDRLPGLTPTRDAYTRAKYGFIIIDDKKAVDLPAGERITVTYEGRERTAVRVPRTFSTGVTVHMLAPRVDNGRPIAVDVATLPPNVTFEGIRATNYELKKSVLTQALLLCAMNPAVLEVINAGRERRFVP